MIKIKHFNNPANKDLDKFLAVQAPRGGNGQSIFFNREHVYILYEDGEPFQKSEQLAQLRELLRGKKNEFFIAEVTIRTNELEAEKTEKELKTLDEMPAGLLDYKEEKKQEKARQTLKNQFLSAENSLTITRFSQRLLQRDIEVLRGLIKDIELGLFLL